MRIFGFVRIAAVISKPVALVLMLVCATMLGCNGGSTSVAKTPTLQSIAVTPAPATIPQGSTQQFTTTATYSDGTTKDISATTAWASSDTAVATISSTGLATGVSTRKTTISAGSSGVSGSTNASVTPVLKSISIAPASYTGEPGATEQLAATGAYSDGTTSDITSTVTWNSSTPAVATVNNAGLVTFVAAGSSSISASITSVSGNAAVTVPALGITGVSNNNPIPLTPVNIGTTGLNVSTPVSVAFSDASGFTATEAAIRVAADGTVVAAVPLYIDKSSNDTGSGTVQVTITRAT